MQEEATAGVSERAANERNSTFGIPGVKNTVRRVIVGWPFSAVFVIEIWSAHVVLF